MKEFGQKQSSLLEKLKKASPDIIAVTGDLINSSHTDINVAMDFIREAVQIAPVYYVTGNHEAWASDSYGILKEALLSSGVCVLENRTEYLYVKGQKLCLMGVNDPAFSKQAIYESSEAVMSDNIGKPGK